MDYFKNTITGREGLRCSSRGCPHTISEAWVEPGLLRSWHRFLIIQPEPLSPTWETWLALWLLALPLWTGGISRVWVQVTSPPILPANMSEKVAEDLLASSRTVAAWFGEWTRGWKSSFWAREWSMFILSLLSRLLLYLGSTDMPLCHSCTAPYGKEASNLFSRPSIHCTPRLVRTLATTNNIAVNIRGKRLLTGEQLPKIDMNFHFDIQCQIIFIQDYEIYLCICACLFPSLQAFHINK